MEEKKEKKKYQKPKGTKDILPKDIAKWHYVENIIRKAMSVFNFDEIRTPTFENTELFKRGVGNETDIVGKEMYTFTDKGGDSITLRPEMTASVMRAYIENGLMIDSPLYKLYYIANMFRHEKPQAGRFREHTQVGAEIIGSDSFYTDVELILLALEIYRQCGIDNVTVKINSLGKDVDRSNFVSQLKNHLSQFENEFSEDNKRRYEKNPLRILDIKQSLKYLIDGPKMSDFLSTNSKNRFDNVQNELTKLGIKYIVDTNLVRGIDYYNDTVFEFISENLGAQNAIGGGGRYDNLIETLGGKPTPGIGFGSGIERILMVAEKNEFEFPSENYLDFYIFSYIDNYNDFLFVISNLLRKLSYKVEFDLAFRSTNKQMKLANKYNANFALNIRNNNTSSTPILSIKDLVNHFDFEFNLPDEPVICLYKIDYFFQMWRFIKFYAEKRLNPNDIYIELDKFKTNYISMFDSEYKINNITKDFLLNNFRDINTQVYVLMDNLINQFKMK